jgi:type IV secretion system protein VirD4
LEKLDIVETAFGTMAGLGVQLWIVTQDLGQLMRLYGDKSWQTFVSNAGVFQYFGSRDYETAQYAEHLCGIMTMKKRSLAFGKTWGTSSSSGPGGGTSGSSSGGSESVTIDDVARPLAYADQMMTLHENKQVLFIENRYPIMARKWWWFKSRKEKKTAA